MLQVVTSLVRSSWVLNLGNLCQQHKPPPSPECSAFRIPWTESKDQIHPRPCCSARSEPSMDVLWGTHPWVGNPCLLQSGPQHPLLELLWFEASGRNLCELETPQFTVGDLKEISGLWERMRRPSIDLTQLLNTGAWPWPFWRHLPASWSLLGD